MVLFIWSSSSGLLLETGLKPVLFFLFQEWSHPDPIFFTHCTNMKYTIKVSFRADIFGTFRQSVIFSFGFEPHLRQDLCVDVVPVLDEEETKIQQLQETLIKQAERYNTGGRPYWLQGLCGAPHPPLQKSAIHPVQWQPDYQATNYSRGWKFFIERSVT